MAKVGNEGALVQGQAIGAPAGVPDTVPKFPGIIGKEWLQAPTQGMMVYQKTSQCCRCCCCQPNIDWTVHEYDPDWGHGLETEPKLYIKEEASYPARCWSFCWPAFRPTKYTVYSGGLPEGEVPFTMEKDCTCTNACFCWSQYGRIYRCPICCFQPYLEAKDTNGKKLGRAQYICDHCLFVPKYAVQDGNGKEIFRVRPDTCCAGLCVRCRVCGGTNGGKCFRIPFPIREPRPPYQQIGDASITDLWAGALHECCTNREMYGVKFPQSQGEFQDAEAMKKTIMATAILIDITWNEQDNVG